MSNLAALASAAWDAVALECPDGISAQTHRSGHCGHYLIDGVVHCLTSKEYISRRARGMLTPSDLHKQAVDLDRKLARRTRNGRTP